MRLRHALRCCCLARVLGLTLRNGWTSADCVGRFGQVKTELQGTAYGPCLRGNPDFREEIQWCQRSIPACAGLAPVRLVSLFRAAGYRRSCGV